MNNRMTESYLRDILPTSFDSLLEVGTGHSGVFDYGNYESMALGLKVCSDIYYIRHDISPNWNKVRADGCELPFTDCSFDVVQCTEVIEHIPKELWERLLAELCRVAKKVVYVTTSDETQHQGPEQEAVEKVNPYVRYIEKPPTNFFYKHGFHVLYEDDISVKVWKGKNPGWDSKFMDMEEYVKQCIGNAEVTSVIDVGTGMKGAVAEHYWEVEKQIKLGYAVDIFRVKYEALQQRVWIPVVDDVFNFYRTLSSKGIDVIQAFGLLEHLTKDDGFKFLEQSGQIAKKLLIVSAATYIHGCGDFSGTYKAKRENNPHHTYLSTWHWKEFENLGFQSNFEDMRKGITFSGEAIAWKKLD